MSCAGKASQHDADHGQPVGVDGTWYDDNIDLEPDQFLRQFAHPFWFPVRACKKGGHLDRGIAGRGSDGDVVTGIGPGEEPAGTQQPRRFYGSVEIDMVRPVKSFDAILNAVVLELQRNPDAKVKITLEIEAETSSGFSEADIGVVRDNARQLKFKAGSTGFE
jgi:hypothetical protein